MMFRFVSGVVATKAAKKATSKMVDRMAERAVARRHPHMKAGQRAVGALPATIVGAACMYFLDPKLGSGRRKQTAQKLRSMMPSSKQVSKKATHIQNVSKGMAISTLHKVRPGNRGDAIVKSARSAISKVTEDGSSLQMEVQNGRLVVSGPIDRNHVDAVRDALKGVPGVQSVEDHLDIREPDHSRN